MSRQKKGLSRARVLTSLVATGVLVWTIGQHVQVNVAAQRGQTTFTGGSPTSLDAAAIRTLRLRFPAGSRSYWHSHTWGQLLMIEEGRGRIQSRGGPVIEMLPGQPLFTSAGIEHWHGAAPDQDSLQLTIYEGTVKWLDPVSDKDYLTPPRK